MPDYFSRMPVLESLLGLSSTPNSSKITFMIFGGFGDDQSVRVFHFITRYDAFIIIFQWFVVPEPD